MSCPAGVPPLQQRGWSERFAGLLVLVVFLTWGFGHDGAFAALALLAAMLVSQGRELWPVLQADPLFLTVVAFLLFLVARISLEAWSGGYGLGEWGGLLRDWILTPFLPVLVFSLWLARFPRCVYHLFWLYPLALLLWALDETNWSHFIGVLEGGGRLVLGHNNPNTMGFFLAIALMGLWVFRRRWVGEERSRLVRRMRGVSWLAMVAGVGYLLLLTSSRSSWLALILVTAIYVAFGVRPGWPKRWPALVWLLVLVGVFAVWGGSVQERVEQRLEGPREIVTAWWHGEEMPNNSGSKRLWMWQHGLQKWSERPWIGWGVRAGGELLQEHPKPFLRHFRDYHNIEVSLLTRFGLVGLTLFGTFFFLLFRELYRSYVRGLLECSEYWFLLSVLLLYLGRSQLSTKIMQDPFLLLLTIVGGAAYMGAWVRRRPGRGTDAAVCG